MQNNLLSWCFTAFVIFLPIIGMKNVLWLHQTLGIPSWLIRLLILFLPLILFLEVVIKIIFLKILRPVQFTAIEINPNTDIADADVVQLNYYDAELKRLGFVKLADYTAPSIAGVARLFAHPKHNCFAEVGFLKDTPVFCSLIAAYTQDWALVISNQQLSSSTNIAYAFLRLPRELVMRFFEKPAFLLNTFLAWDREITEALKINIIKDITVATYFTLNNQRLAKQRKSLIRKSIIWGLIETWLFSKNPRLEYLGDYKKIRSVQS